MRIGRHSFIWASLTATMLVGCKNFFAPRGIPDDPILRDRQPIESKGEVMPQPMPKFHEPMPPGGN